MDTAQWPKHQVVGLSRTMEEIATPNSSNNNPTNSSRGGGGAPQMVERRARPQKDQNLNCPRCNSTNTKFCYYNNYSLTQPRYFCKTCRRYWTQGGSLRNVPVGGGSRKNRRSASSILVSSTTSSSSSAAMAGNPTMPTTKLIPDLNPPTSLSHLLTASQNPKFFQGQDLNLDFPIQGIFQPLDHQLPKIELNNNNNNNNNNENHEPVLNMNNGNINSTTTTCTTTTTTTTAPLSALELLRTGIASRGSLNSFAPMPMPDSNTLYPSALPNLQEFKPNMQGHHVFTSSSGDHHQHHHSNMIGSGANVHNVGGTTARLLFPFADMNKLASSTTTNHHHHEIHEDQNKGSGNDHHHHHHNHHHQGPSAGYWTGMLGGGTW